MSAGQGHSKGQMCPTGLCLARPYFSLHVSEVPVYRGDVTCFSGRENLSNLGKLCSVGRRATSDLGRIRGSVNTPWACSYCYFRPDEISSCKTLNFSALVLNMHILSDPVCLMINAGLPLRLPQTQSWFLAPVWSWRLEEVSLKLSPCIPRIPTTDTCACCPLSISNSSH